jgi:hypothetical protein
MYMDELEVEQTYSPEEVAILLGLKLRVVMAAIKCGDLESLWLVDRYVVSHQHLGNYVIARLKEFRSKKPKVIRSRKKSRTY